MTTSGSYNFQVTRSDIITEALELLGKIPEEEPITAAETTSASRSLNLLCKQLMVEQGLRLWKIRDAVVFFAYGQRQYSLNSTSSGANASLSSVKTEVATAAISGATTLTVDSVTGMATGYNIGIELDNNTIQWTTISSIAGTTITLAVALTNAVSVDNHVYVYQTKLERPLRVISVRYIDSDDMENPIYVTSREEYEQLPSKNEVGRVNLVYYQPLLTTGELYVWNAPNDMKARLSITIMLPIEDFDTNSNDADFPIEWGQALTYGLAHKLSYKYGMDKAKRDDLKAEFAEAVQAAKNWDKEVTPVYFTPYSEYDDGGY